jgi:dCTP deaminase
MCGFYASGNRGKEWGRRASGGAQLICFTDGKSTRARTGILVHLTAPTIHAAWRAWPITLEIVNVGRFDLALEEDDVIARLRRSARAG